jgi:hypothetical protein
MRTAIFWPFLPTSSDSAEEQGDPTELVVRARIGNQAGTEGAGSLGDPAGL